MNEQKKRIVALMIVLVIGGGLVSLAARSNEQSDAAEKATPQTDTPLQTDSDAPQWPELPTGNQAIFYRMMLAVGAVGVLAVAAMYLLKRVLPRVTNTTGKEIRIIETTYLGPRKAIHLVEVSNQKLLIGSTNESIAMLTHLEGGWLSAPDPEADKAMSL